MSTNNGGAAFPVPSGTLVNQGMTLRDYFAAKVLPTMITDGAALEAIKMMAKKTGMDAFELTAKMCYEYADALLKERAK